MEQLDQLEATFLEEYRAATLLLKNGMVKSSLILFSKALFALADYLIFKKYSLLPKNHGERFRILEIKEPKLYVLLDTLWSTYTDAYTKASGEEATVSFKKAILEVITHDEIFSESIKAILKR
ncbi:hypothetical protein HZB02_02620 [Candidatus Woesearchaeota archaeon]|nr:hypothetical protein [Candidatus Woesearchaeota archaeon]